MSVLACPLWISSPRFAARSMANAFDLQHRSLLATGSLWRLLTLLQLWPACLPARPAMFLMRNYFNMLPTLPASAPCGPLQHACSPANLLTCEMEHSLAPAERATRTSRLVWNHNGAPQLCWSGLAFGALGRSQRTRRPLSCKAGLHLWTNPTEKVSALLHSLNALWNLPPACY